MAFPTSESLRDPCHVPALREISLEEFKSGINLIRLPRTFGDATHVVLSEYLTISRHVALRGA